MTPIFQGIRSRMKESAGAARIRGKKVRAIRFKAIEEEEIRTAKAIERIRATRKIKRAETGGYFGQISRAYATRPKVRPEITRPVTRKKKKKGRARAITRRAPPKQQSIFGGSDFLGGL